MMQARGNLISRQVIRTSRARPRSQIGANKDNFYGFTNNTFGNSNPFNSRNMEADVSKTISTEGVGMDKLEDAFTR